MAYRRRNRRRFNRRRPTRRPRYTRNRTRKRITMRNKSTTTLIAPRFITKLRYAERVTIPASVAVGLASAYLFNLNSIYDPDRTGVGHQPMGRDQLALLYHRYRVFGVSWRIEFTPTESTSISSLFVLPANNSVSVAGYPLSHVRESPHVMVKMASRNNSVVFRGRQSLPRLTGQTSTQYKAGLEYQAKFDNDPSELMTLQVGTVPITGSGTWVADVVLNYHVECFDPIPLSQS